MQSLNRAQIVQVMQNEGPDPPGCCPAGGVNFLVIPGGRIQAADWLVCAIAPPSGPCSSGSLSNAAAHLPVSDSPRTRPLQHKTNPDRYGQFYRNRTFQVEMNLVSVRSFTSSLHLHLADALIQSDLQ